ncbi:MAG: hypothetical protein JWP01_2602, partial [Myxococcales bacterium]|nr:hypothetical protein [Myxococcales bacterium]
MDSNSQPPAANPRIAALALPAFRALEVTEIPQGFAITPIGTATDFWIEAIVWVVGAILLTLCIVLGGPVLRVLGAIGVVGVSLRAVVRIAKAIFGRSLRRLRVLVNAPRRTMAGPFGSVSLDELATLALTRRGNATYIHAVTLAGK